MNDAFANSIVRLLQHRKGWEGERMEGGRKGMAREGEETRRQASNQRAEVPDQFNGVDFELG